MNAEDYLTEDNRKVIEQVYEAVTNVPVNVEFNEDETGFHLDNGFNIYPEVVTVEEKTIGGRKPVERLIWIVDVEVMHPGSYWEPPDYDFNILADDLRSIYDAIRIVICAEVADQINNITEANSMNDALC